MLIAEEPYFMKDSSWYYFDEKEFRYKLTDKAPNEAIVSYKEFYEQDLEQYDIMNIKIKDAK